jgi:FtsH-binding integral membrane protein
MSMFNRGPFGQQGFGGFPIQDNSMAGSPAIAGFFNAVYGWMAAGLGVTALVAWLVSQNADAMATLLHGPMLIGLFIAEFILVIAVAGAVNRINANVATALFLLY